MNHFVKRTRDLPKQYYWFIPVDGHVLVAKIPKLNA